jgi:hypothetical protein
VSETAFSKELEAFIAGQMQSLEQLEILLLLSGNPHKWWSVATAYEVIKSSPGSVAARLEELAARGMVRKEAGPEVRYQFSPDDPALWKVVNELREAYKERPVKIVQAIYSKPPDAVQEFAKAFRVRRDK